MGDQLDSSPCSSHPWFEAIAHFGVYFVVIHLQYRLISFRPTIYKITKVFYVEVYVGADPCSFTWKIKICVNGWDQASISQEYRDLSLYRIPKEDCTYNACHIIGQKLLLRRAFSINGQELLSFGFCILNSTTRHNNGHSSCLPWWKTIHPNTTLCIPLELYGQNFMKTIGLQQSTSFVDSALGASWRILAMSHNACSSSPNSFL